MLKLSGKQVVYAIITLITIVITYMFLSSANSRIDTHSNSGVGVIQDRRGNNLSLNTEAQGTMSLLSEIRSNKSSDDGDLALSLDEGLQSHIYRTLDRYAQNYEYAGGSSVVMDVETGELLALVSYPESPQDTDEYVNKTTNGLYEPGSVIKPFIAVAALAEDIIDPEKEILSTDSIQLPNPFQDGKFFVYNDWKAHGLVDMRKAIGVSSNVYFYSIGGGFEDQPGLGIEKMEKYLRMFGFGQPTGIDLLSESEGALPNPEWKAEKFNGDEWRLGDTYLTAIGQHGYEVTPLQLARATAAIANNGQLIKPKLLHTDKVPTDAIKLPIAKEHFRVVQDGMEYAVINGTAAGLYLDGMTIAAKTGTAEIDTEKEFIHSWIVGYFPHDNPRYVFTFMLEQGPWGEEVGAVAVAREVLLWIQKNRTEYLTEPKI